MNSQPINRPCVVIVGRPNVGKSTLFNRLLGKRLALVHDSPGVTRDRLKAEATWWVDGKKLALDLIDTGGLGEGRFSKEIALQVETALNEASVVLLVFDAQAGLTDEDRNVISGLRKAGVMNRVPVIALANKTDDPKHEELATDFYAAGFDLVLPISAEHNIGIQTLQEQIADFLPNDWESATTTGPVGGPPKIAIVGRPNVGKSTLVNALLGEERMIVSPIAGTTVDPVDSLVKMGGREYLFVDTAGIRRKSKTEQGVEVLSVLRTRKALERAELAILVLNGEEGIGDQDEKIGGIIEEMGCSVILAVNKWDTQVDNADFDEKEASKRIRDAMGFLNYAPIIFISAREKLGLSRLAPLIEDVLHQRKFQIPTHELTEWMRREVDVHNPQNARFYFCHQTGMRPPTIVCHVNDPEKIHFSLKRHLINAARERWGYMGTPLRLLLKQHKSTRARRPRGTATK